MKARVLVVWCITCAIWSTVWLAIKVGVRDLPPISFAGWRLVLALVVLAPIALVHRAAFRRTRREWLLILSNGVLLLGVNYAFVFSGARYIPSGLVAVIQGTTPAFGLLFSRIVRREPPRWIEALAIAIGVAGLAIVFSDQLSVSGSRWIYGCAAVAAGAACVAFAYVAAGAYLRGIPPLVMTTAQMTAGCIPLVIAGALLEGNPARLHWTPSALAALAYLALAGSVAAFWLNYWLLQRTSATALMTMSIVEPLIALLLGAAILDEPLSARILGGAALILASTYVTLRRG